MSAFGIFKYTVYALLVANVGLFLVEDLAASRAMFPDGVPWPRFIETYAQTMDTAAWVVLLLLFELETAVLSDETLRAGWARRMSAVRFVCYAIVGYSAYGYLATYGFVTQTIPIQVGDLCSLVGADFTYVQTLNQYPPLDLDACQALGGKDLLQIDGTRFIGSYEQLERARLLALADCINSIDWIAVVVVLEVEVFLQLRGRLSAWIDLIGRVIKAVLYSLLFVVAGFWALDGALLDFWDAALWIVSFIFIEMNFFEWQRETEARLD